MEVRDRGETNKHSNTSRASQTQRRETKTEKGVAECIPSKTQSVYENGGSGILLKHTLSPVFW